MRRILILGSLSLALAGLSACGQADRQPGEPGGDAGASAGAGGAAWSAGAARAGLWEVTSVTGGETDRFRECRAAGLDLDNLGGEAASDCEVSESIQGGELVMSSQCRLNEAELATTFRVSGSDVAYRGQMEMVLTRDGEELARTQTVTEGRWISDCPAGMAPGDIDGE